MVKIAKTKKKVSKTKTKTVSKPKTVSKQKVSVSNKSKEGSKNPIKISKNYIPKEKEKYMCEKHKVYFRMKLQDQKELIKSNNKL